MRTIGRWSVASVVSIALGFGRFVIALSLVVAALLTLALPFLPNPDVTVTVPVSFTIETPPPIQIGRSGLNFDIRNPQQPADGNSRGAGSVEGSLKIPTRDRWFVAAQSTVLVGVLALLLFVIAQLHAVFRTLIHAHPFVPENAARIHRVGLAVIVGECARAAIVHAENLYARAHVTIAGLQFDEWPHLTLSTIGYGLVILVIAEVFRAGTRLDEERSLTI